MGLIDSIRQAFAPKKKEAVTSTPTGYEAYGMGGGVDFGMRKNPDFLNEMRGWVASAVSAISDEVASINIRLYKQEGDKVEEVLEHPILDLLFRVNPFTTKFDHFWLSQAFLELTGESPWFLERDGSGEIKNIYFLRPDKIRPITGDNYLIAGYEYDIGGKRIKLALEDVLFLKYPNPAKPFRGIGTLEMAARTVDIDNYSEEWNRNFYSNSARPDSILSVDAAQLTPEQRDALKSQLKEMYEGVNKAHKTMVLFGSMNFEKSSFSQKDMDFLEQQRFGRDKILGIFRVPKAIVSQTEGVNFASAKAAQYVFARWTIKPKMERLIQQLNEFLLPLFDGTDNMFLDYDNPVPSDEEADTRKFESALKNGYMTINEVRYEMDLPPVEGGDVIYLPLGLRPIDQAGKEVPTSLGYKSGHTQKQKFSEDRLNEMRARGKNYFGMEKIKKAIRKEVIKKIKQDQLGVEVKTVKTAPVNRKVLDETEQLNFWSQKNKVFKKWMPKVKEDMIDVFKEQRKQVLTKLYQHKKGVVKKTADELYKDIKLDIKKEVKRTVDLTFDNLEALFLEAGIETYELLELESEFDITREEIQKLLRDNGRIFAKNVSETTNDFIKEQIFEGSKKGESIDEMANRIKGVFDKAEDYRSDRIARTEALRYNTSATEQAFKDSGIVEGKMWVTNPNPCDYCATLAGKTAGLGEVMVSKGSQILDRTFDYDDLPAPPLHPNCECDLIPIFKPTK